MSHFTPIPSLLGGALIGLAATALFLFNGRIAGVSGIVSGLLWPEPGESRWRAPFIGGLVTGGLILRALRPQAFAGAAQAPLASLAVAGLLVGLGAAWAGGCTSGHGVCGNARLSPRSMLATLLFIAAGALVVFVVHRGGPS
jgi:uncharacterized membrane protein YedE/YeeE